MWCGVRLRRRFRLSLTTCAWCGLGVLRWAKCGRRSCFRIANGRARRRRALLRLRGRRTGICCLLGRWVWALTMHAARTCWRWRQRSTMLAARRPLPCRSMMRTCVPSLCSKRTKAMRLLGLTCENLQKQQGWPRALLLCCRRLWTESPSCASRPGRSRGGWCAVSALTCSWCRTRFAVSGQARFPRFRVGISI